MVLLGFLLLAIGGGLLHDVPFTRFMLAFFCITFGNTLISRFA